MRKRYFWDRERREWVEHQPPSVPRMVVVDRERVMGDGVKSMIDGKVYTSRRAYEDHVRAHDKVIIGNDVIEHRKMPEPTDARPLIERYLSEMG